MTTPAIKIAIDTANASVDQARRHAEQLIAARRAFLKDRIARDDQVIAALDRNRYEFYIDRLLLQAELNALQGAEAKIGMVVIKGASL